MTKTRGWADAFLSSQRWLWRNQSDLEALSGKGAIQQGWSRGALLPGIRRMIRDSVFQVLFLMSNSDVTALF